MRPFRSLALLLTGAFAGFMGAAAIAKRALPSRGDAESDEVSLTAIFDGVQLESRAQAFRGGSMFAWFGGIEVDLREATLADEAHLTVHTLFGGVAIRVPPGWRIESSLNAVAGGVDVSVPEPDEGAPTLKLEGFALCGGVAVGAKADAAVFANA